MAEGGRSGCNVVAGLMLLAQKCFVWLFGSPCKARRAANGVAVEICKKTTQTALNNGCYSGAAPLCAQGG